MNKKFDAQEFLNKYSELIPFYKEEREILSSCHRQMTPYLFFQYVVTKGLKAAINENNNELIKELFNDMEVLCQKDYDYYSDIIITAVFESFSKTELERHFECYFGKKIKMAFEIYLKN